MMLFNVISYGIEACLALTIGLFIPLNIYIINNSEINFSITSALLLFILVSFVSFIVLFIISFILNKFFPRAAAIFKLLIFGLMLGFFIQTYFINPDYGVLDGRNINWDDYINYGIINTIIWICCLLIPFILSYFLKQEKFILLRNAAIIIAFCQCLQVAYNYYNIDIDERSGYALSEDPLLDVSENKNIIVFILDTFQTDYFSDIVKKYPKVAAAFCDFVYYPDTTSMYPYTQYALPLILLGKPYYNQMPWKEYISSSWKDNSFYNVLKAHNFDVDLFTFNWDLHENAKNISNIYKGYYKIRSERKFIHYFYKLSFFVSMPHFIKKYFLVYAAKINSNSKFIVKNKQTSFYYLDDNRFFNNLNNKKMTINKKNKFMLYHLWGAHPPYILNSKSQPVKRSTREEQCLGALNIVLRYIQLLKDNNVYDKTTMIIMADHGSYAQHFSAPLFLVKPEFHKSDTIEFSDASLSYEDIHSLFLYFSGLSKEISNGKEDIFCRKQRLFFDYKWSGCIDENQRTLSKYIITGRANNSKSWKFVEYIQGHDKNDNNYILGTDIFTTWSNRQTVQKYRLGGWYWPERTHIWTRDASSGLEFSVNHGAKKDLLFSVDLVPFIKRGNAAQEVTVFANGSKVAEWNIPTGGVYTALIPASVMETDKLHIRFDIAYPAKPENETMGDGLPRVLGIAVKRLSIDLADKGTVNHASQKAEGADFSKIPYYELGKALSFGEKDAAVNARHKISGWSFQEPLNTWMDGKNAELAFRIKEGAGKDLTLELKGHPYLKPGLAAQRVAVFANDVPIAEWNMSKDGVFTAEIPAVAMRSELLLLRFAISDPARPCENGVSSDIRELGMGVTELTLRDR